MSKSYPVTCDWKHCGIDIVAEYDIEKNEGVEIKAPFNGKVIFPRTEENGIYIQGNTHVVGIFYIDRLKTIKEGDEVYMNQSLGRVINLKYENITNHVHINMFKLIGNTWDGPIDPTPFVQVKTD